MLTETAERLEQWGRWVRNGGYQSGYTSVNMGLGSTVATPHITDEEALAVDCAVARLKQREPILGLVITCYYVRRWSHAVIAREIGQPASREKIRRLLGSGEAWIDAVIWDEKTKLS